MSPVTSAPAHPCAVRPHVDQLSSLPCIPGSGWQGPAGLCPALSRSLAVQSSPVPSSAPSDLRTHPSSTAPRQARLTCPPCPRPAGPLDEEEGPAGGPGRGAVERSRGSRRRGAARLPGRSEHRGLRAVCCPLKGASANSGFLTQGHVPQGGPDPDPGQQGGVKGRAQHVPLISGGSRVRAWEGRSDPMPGGPEDATLSGPEQGRAVRRVQAAVQAASPWSPCAVTPCGLRRISGRKGCQVHFMANPTESISEQMLRFLERARDVCKETRMSSDTHTQVLGSWTLRPRGGPAWDVGDHAARTAHHDGSRQSHRDVR